MPHLRRQSPRHPRWYRLCHWAAPWNRRRALSAKFGRKISRLALSFSIRYAKVPLDPRQLRKTMKTVNETAQKISNAKDAGPAGRDIHTR